MQAQRFSRPRFLLLGGGLLSLLAIGAYLLLGRSASPDSILGEVPAWELTPGQQLRYEMVYKGSLPATQQSFEVRGELSLTVLAREGEGYAVWLRLEEEESSEHPLSPEQAAELLPQLKSGVALQLADRGFSLREAEGSSALSEFWRSFASRTQVHLPQRLSGESYTWPERYEGQDIVANYILEESGALDFSRGLSLQKSFENQTQRQRVKASGRLRLRPGMQGLAAFDLAIEEEWPTPAAPVVLRSELSLSWRGERSIDLASWKASPPAPAPPQQLAIQKQVLGSRAWNDILREIEALAPGQAWPQALYLRLKAWISLHPEQFPLLLDWLAREGDPTHLLRPLIKALAGVGSEAAQELLVELMEQQRGSLEEQKRVVTSLGLVSSPSPLAREAIQKLIHENREGTLVQRARLTLGMMGHQLRKSGAAAEARGIEEVLWLELEASTGTRQRDALAALGNFGPSQIERLEPYLHHSDGAMRGGAYWALRFAPAPQTPQILLRSFWQEKDPAARRQIFQALSLRPPHREWQDAIRALAQGPAVETYALELARMLGRRASQLGKDGPPLFSLLQSRITDPGLQKRIAVYEDQMRLKQSPTL